MFLFELRSHVLDVLGVVRCGQHQQRSITVGAISDEAARSFAVGFYRGLGNGSSVGRAFDQAVATLAGKGLPDEPSWRRSRMRRQTHDIFDVDPSGTGWHTAIQIGGARSHILFNDKPPGSWSRFLRAEWSVDKQTLYAYGRGWLNGEGGTTFYISWNSTSEVWSDPVKEPLQP